MKSSGGSFKVDSVGSVTSRSSKRGHWLNMLHKQGKLGAVTLKRLGGLE